MKCLIISVLVMVSLTSCRDTLSGLSGATSGAEVSVEFEANGNIDFEGLIDPVYTFRNIANNRSSRFSSLDGLSLIPGLYDISFEGKLKNDLGVVSSVRASKQSVQLVDGLNSLTLQAYCNVATDDLIISEIFFAGTLQPSGNQYNGDSYIKLYNNTDHVVYADGISFFETKFLTTEKRQYTPDIMTEAVAVDAIYTIPGDGASYPVEPGGELLICDVAMDHRVANPNSFDLSAADFEWYDESTTPSTTDIDNPAVANLDKWYCYTQSVWIPHNRGFKAFGLARIPIGRDEYLANYRYSFDYELVTAAGSFPMSGDAYRLPNEWVVDAVSCSVESAYAWQVMSPAIDSGWTYCGTIDKDKTRFFRSVRRKVQHFAADGRMVLCDTNNSSEDFNANVIPSEVERQSTAIDCDGTKSTSVTYDGVILK